ncbi:unnamed protein product [Paramecium sonneborni]|uniref:Anoctamin transmembrane domain-containing protein n=1 Tax=Paramecium sonneborni TaxID=65129 RepID=A0A8S1KPW2_9CILI|nr:unnamed protein product [Paramecium sonneborni]
MDSMQNAQINMPNLCIQISKYRYSNEIHNRHQIQSYDQLNKDSRSSINNQKQQSFIIMIGLNLIQQDLCNSRKWHSLYLNLTQTHMDMYYLNNIYSKVYEMSYNKQPIKLQQILIELKTTQQLIGIKFFVLCPKIRKIQNEYEYFNYQFIKMKNRIELKKQNNFRSNKQNLKLQVVLNQKQFKKANINLLILQNKFYLRKYKCQYNYNLSTFIHISQLSIQISAYCKLKHLFQYLILYTKKFILFLKSDQFSLIKKKGKRWFDTIFQQSQQKIIIQSHIFYLIFLKIVGIFTKKSMIFNNQMQQQYFSKMSYSNLSPSSQSSESNSQRSRSHTVNFDVIHDPVLENKNQKNQKNQRASLRNLKMEKMVRTVNQYLQTYEIYLKLLFGRQIKSQDEQKMNYKFGQFIEQIDVNVLPEAVLKFPNPDCQQCEQLEIMSPIDTILFIEKVLKLDMKKIDNQIFMKAVEGVFTKLSPCLKRSKSKFGFKQNSNLKSETILDQIPLDQENVQTPFESIQQRRWYRQSSHKKVDPLTNLVMSMQHKLMGSETINLKLYKQTDTFDLDYSLIKEMKPKIMQGGGYFVFKNGKWNRSDEDTSDVLTLIRQIMLIQIMINGFSVKSCITDDGRFILCRLYAHEENLKTLAQRQKLKKKLNFWFTDLFSMEPVDNCYRPLRLNNRIWKPNDYDDVTEMFLYLRPKIIKLLDEINFKRVSRETNQSRINGQLFQYGKMDLQDDEDQPTDEQWFAFYQYLVHLEKEISKLRKNFKIDSDVSAIINKQLKPYDLYVIRNQKKEEIKKLNKNNIKDESNRIHQIEIKKIQQRVFNVIQEYQHFLTEDQVPHTKLIKLFKKERLASNYQSIFEEALKVANSQKQLLFTIWDLIDVQRLEPYVVYSKPSMLISPLMKLQHIMCWCKYQINEFKKISLFSSSERLKLTDQAINNMFLLNDLISKKVVSQFFCVNDHYELFGHLSCSQNDFMLEDDFYRKKIYHLEFEWSFNIQKPWSAPIVLICDYYGQKIGLYFYYQTYYTKMLLKIAFIALGCNLVQWVIQDDKTDLNYLLRIIFAFVQIQWTNLFVVIWQKKQLIFNLQFGQSGKDEIQVQRSNFIGKNRRSVENDQLNNVGIDELELYSRMVLATLILILLILLYSGVVICLYILTIALKLKMQEDKTVRDTTFEVMVTATINIVIIQFLDKVYDIIATKLTDFENQKTVKDYEESFVTKKYILYFISYVGPLIIIAFLNEPFNLYCKETNCQEHIQYHFATMIIWVFFFKTVKMFQLIINVKKIPIFKYKFEEISISKYIQEQSNRQSYAISQERYGTLEDYMEIFLQNTLLSIFGYSFPFSFFLLWVQNIAQMQADKAKFIYFLQRPWPQNNSSLGVWNKILELINYVCILTNTGQMTMEYNKKYGYEILLAYLMFLIFNFSMNFIMNGTFGQIPYELGLFIKRQKYLIKHTIEQFSKNQTSGQQSKHDDLKRFPIFKIYSTVNDQFSGEFETVSSEDDLESHYDLNQMKFLCKNDNKKEQQIVQKKQGVINNDKQKKTTIQEKLIQKQKINERKQRDILKDEVMSDQVMLNYFLKRKFNWAFEIKSWKRNFHKKFIKTMQFLYQKQLLNLHKTCWCDLRVSHRYLYMKRKTTLLRQLELRKLIIFKRNEKKIIEQYKERAKIKFRKQFKMFDPKSKRLEEIQELEALQKKFDTYVYKHAQLDSTKVVVIKMKGIWFSQYRKSTIKTRSLSMVKDFFFKTKLIDKLKGDSGLQDQVEASLGDPHKLDSITLEHFIKTFWSLGNASKEQFELPLCTKELNIMDYYKNKKKSETYFQIVDKFRDTYVFDYQYQKLQEITMQYFEEEMFPIEPIKLQRQLSETVWICTDKYKKQCLIQFLQIRHEQQLRINPDCAVNYGVFYVKAYPQIRLSNIVDQVDDFYIKGYCVFKYEILSQYTLKHIIKYRYTYSLEYSLTDLNEFLHANLILLKQQSHGNLNINNYYLFGRSYVLLQSNKQENDLVNLAQVVIEMILLQPVENAIRGYQQLSTLHSLRPVLMLMIFESPSIDELIDKLISKHSFMEYNINQDDRHKSIKQEDTILGQLALATHQINLNFRMKQHQETLKEISVIEKFLMSKKFQENEEFLDSFLSYLIVHQNQIISKQSEIKLLFNILLIIYIKFATLLQMRQNFLFEMEQLYHTLIRSVENINDLIKQLSLNVKLEQLSTTEQKILLRRRQTRSKSQIDLTAADRMLLIQKIRKHPTYIKVICQLKKELQRYSLQLQALHSIYLYFNKNFLYSAQLLENIQKIQTEIIHSDHKIQLVIEEPQDLSPSQFNFDQQSPTLDASLKQYQDQTFELQKEFNDSPNYCLQLLFYKYLQLLVWYDGGKEKFQNDCIDFIQNQIESPVFDYFSSQLKVIQKFEIPGDYIEFNKTCQIGKFIVINMNKWIEQTYLTPTKYEASNDFQFNWKQVLTFSTIEQSLENRLFLSKIIGQTKTNLNYLLLEIRAIHQLLHLDNYRPLDHQVNLQNLDTSNLKHDFLNNSLINRLKVLHNEISIESDSWFHCSGLLQFRVFYIHSLCFSFSKKHFENMYGESSNLLFLAEIALKQISFDSQSDAHRMKAYQILQKPYQLFEMKSNVKSNQISQIISSFFFMSQYYSIQEKEQYFKSILDLYGEQVKPSLVILALIHFYLSKGQKEIVQLIIKTVVKLIHLDTQIFQNAHLSFIDDLHISLLECNQDVVEYLYPYDCLFKRTTDIRSFSSNEQILNLKYLIYNQFFHQDPDFNIDILEDHLKLFSSYTYMIKLKNIYQLFILVQKSIKGEATFEEMEIFLKMQFEKITVYSSIIKSLLARYYINLKSYEEAKPLLEELISFLYSIQIKSNLLLFVDKTNFKIYNNVPIFKMLFDVQLEEIAAEDTDNQYCHLIDEQFIQETIIYYLEVLANTQNETLNMPSIQVILSFFFQVKNFGTQQNLFKVLSQIFLCYSSPIGVEMVQEQLGTTYEQQIQTYIQQRSQLKERLNHLFLIKQLSVEESNRINSQINLYNFAIGIYEGISKGISNKTLLTWSISAAEKALIGFRIVCKSFQRSIHYQIADLHLTLTDCFVQLEQLSTIIFHLEAAEDELMTWFKYNKHPLKAHFLMKQGALRPWIQEQYIIYISWMNELPRLNRLNIFTIIRQLLLQNRKLLQIFEQNNQDLINLEINLLLYLKGLDESQQVYVDIFELCKNNDPELLLKQVTTLSAFDFNGVNILMDAQAIFQTFNQNNCFTQRLQIMIDQMISKQIN